MGLLSNLFGRGEPVDAVLYTRPDCGLCEAMKQEMARAGVEGRYRLREIDVDTDRALKKRYGLRIPVLSLDGEECFEGRLTAPEFRTRVRQVQRNRRSKQG